MGKLGDIAAILGLGIVGGVLFMFATGRWKFPEFKWPWEGWKLPTFPEFKFPTIPEFLGWPVITLEAMGVEMPRVVTLEEQWTEKFRAKAAEVGVRLEPAQLITQNGEVVARRAPYPVYPQRLPTMVIPPTAREIPPKMFAPTPEMLERPTPLERGLIGKLRVGGRRPRRTLL